MMPIVPSASTSRIPAAAASAVIPPPMMRYLKEGIVLGSVRRGSGLRHRHLLGAPGARKPWAPRQAPASALRTRDLPVPEAARQVIVDHAGRLHERVADRAADEAEPALPQRLAHRVRLGRRRGDPPRNRPCVPLRLAYAEAPQKFRGRAEPALENSVRLPRGAHII